MGKGKVSCLYAMEAFGGGGGKAPTHSCPRHYWPFASWRALAGMRGDEWRHAVRQRKRNTRVKNLMLLSILKKKLLSSQQFCSANVNFHQLYVFAMNNKASPPSTNTTKKCRDLFPYFPGLESRLAGEHTVDGGEWSASRPGRALPPRKGLPVSIG
jgi:hypothetical protein